MKKTITITRKGQTTLPADIRSRLGIPKSGGVLAIRYDDKKGEVILSRSAGIADIAARVSRYIKPGVQPLEDPGDYYQAAVSGARGRK